MGAYYFGRDKYNEDCGNGYKCCHNFRGRIYGNVRENQSPIPVAPPEKLTPYNVTYTSASEDSSFGAYPVCKMKWLPNKAEIQTGEWLSILDLAAFTRISYFDDEEAMKTNIMKWFKNTVLDGPVKVQAECPDVIARVSSFNLSSLKTVVIAIRGSRTQTE